MKEETLLVNGTFLLERTAVKGGWTYVIIPSLLTYDKVPAGGVRVRGHVDDYEIKDQHLHRLSNGKLFLPMRAEIRKRINKLEGDWVNIVFYAVGAPELVPDGFLICLEDNKEAHNTYLSYTAREQKAFVEWIYAAKKGDERVERIARTLDMLERKQKLPK